MDLLNNPMINQAVFYPRQAPQGVGLYDGAIDGSIDVDGASLGYRLYPMQTDTAVLYFHGNGEIVPDHDLAAPQFHQAGASLLVVDYRGYGWSTGKPTVKALLPDAETVAQATPKLLKDANLDIKYLFVMGRSLGSLTAVHLAARMTDMFHGLMLDSAIANSKTIMMRLLGMAPHMLDGIDDPMDSVGKLTHTDLPLLVIHGEEDQLIPVANAQALFAASPAADKTLLRVPRAGHNDILYHAADVYYQAVMEFLKRNTVS